MSLNKFSVNTFLEQNHVLSFHSHMLKIIKDFANNLTFCQKSYHFLDFSQVNSSRVKTSEKMKYILLYNKFFRYKTWLLDSLGRELFVKSGCPVTNCFVTLNHNHLARVEQFDAIVVHMMPRKLYLPDQSKRPKDQRYVMFMMETPMVDKTSYSNLKSKWQTVLA